LFRTKDRLIRRPSELRQGYHPRTACFDRQTQLAGLAVDVCHTNVDLVANAETLWALLGTVAGQVGTTDEGCHAFVGHFHAAIFDLGHFNSDDRATLYAANSVCERITVQRFDGQRNTLFLDVDFSNLGFDHVTFAEITDDVFAAAFPSSHVRSDR